METRQWEKETLLFTTKPRRRPNFRSDAFRLLPTFEQALIDEHDDGGRKDGRAAINMIPCQQRYYLQQSPGVGVTLGLVYFGFYRLQGIQYTYSTYVCLPPSIIKAVKRVS